MVRWRNPQPLKADDEYGSQDGYARKRQRKIVELKHRNIALIPAHGVIESCAQHRRNRPVQSAATGNGFFVSPVNSVAMAVVKSISIAVIVLCTFLAV